jgi:hypothetical protein
MALASLAIPRSWPIISRRVRRNTKCGAFPTSEGEARRGGDVISAIDRAAAVEWGQLMGMGRGQHARFGLGRMGRPRTEDNPAQVERRFACAFARLRGEMTAAEAAVRFGVTARCVEQWVAWAASPDNPDPRASELRRLAACRRPPTG